MKIRLLLVTILLILANSCSKNHDEIIIDDKNIIEGIVITYPNDLSISGAKVILYKYWEFTIDVILFYGWEVVDSVFTDDLGRYTFRNIGDLAINELAIEAQKEGFINRGKIIYPERTDQIYRLGYEASIYVHIKTTITDYPDEILISLTNTDSLIDHKCEKYWKYYGQIEDPIKIDTIIERIGFGYCTYELSGRIVSMRNEFNLSGFYALDPIIADTLSLHY